ncbi:esterase [Lithospermum erythrorhizon]|uniref:Esterase n=1 Tax=Lithospermum erythrorhizon TaxID=34254 RepID=A0AAV3PQY7_LITER
MMFTFIWLMLLVYSIDSSISQINSVFILAGQSNMAGRGGVVHETTWDGYVPPQCQSNPSIFRLNAELTWVEAAEPLHKDIDSNKTCGVGPGMAFANSVVSRDPNIGVIGLVPCAVGGTNISEWRRGSHLYNQLMRRSNAALGSGGRIRALLWYQGESDTLNHQDAKLYKKRLTRLFNHLRSDLQLPSLPLIMVALASGEGPFVEVVRQAQLGNDLPYVKLVDAKGMALETDQLHLTTVSQVQLGHMLADAFLQRELPLPAQSRASKLPRSFVFGVLSTLIFKWILTF